MSETLATIDHETIRRWAEERKGHPAAVRETGGEEDPGLIRIDFPGYSGEESLEEISWEDFFRKFEAAELAFLYREREDGERSNFNKLVKRDTVRDRL